MFQNGLLIDNYTVEFKNGDKLTIKDNDKSYYFSDVSFYKGGIENLSFSGEGFLIDEEGNKYQGIWKDGKLYQNAKIYYSTGDSYEGELQDNKIHGIGKYTTR